MLMQKAVLWWSRRMTDRNRQRTHMAQNGRRKFWKIFEKFFIKFWKFWKFFSKAKPRQNEIFQKFSEFFRNSGGGRAKFSGRPGQEINFFWVVGFRRVLVVVGWFLCRGRPPCKTRGPGKCCITKKPTRCKILENSWKISEVIRCLSVSKIGPWPPGPGKKAKKSKQKTVGKTQGKT